MMIATLAVIGVSAISIDVTAEQAHSTAISFLQRAERGIGSQIPPAASELQRTFDEQMNCYVFMGKAGSAYVNKRSGKVLLGGVSVPFARPEWPASPLPEATVRQLAQEFFEAAGHGGELYTHLVEQLTEAPPYYRLHCSPKYNGIPFALAHHVEFHIDAASGKLRMLGATRELPRPPLVSTPLINVDQARAAMAQAIFTLNPETANKLAGPRRTTTIEEFFNVRLNIWLPDVEYGGAWPLPEHFADAQAGRGRLVYTAAFNDIDAPLVEEGVHARRFEAYVDAVSGRTLCVYVLVPAGGGANTSPKSRSLIVKPSTLDVLVNGKSTRVGTVSISKVPAPNSLGKTLPVALRVGRRIYSLEFEPRLGLLTTKGADRSFGKPDTKLLRVLRKMLQ